MSKTDLLHYELCCKGAAWMRRLDYGSYKYVVVELVCIGAENPDVWGTNGMQSVLIEVKTSRADFLADKHKVARKDSTYACGNRRYYLVPKGIIDIDDLPDHWGLLEWDGKKITVTQEADEIPCENHGELAILCSIMRREGVKKGIFNYHHNKKDEVTE